MKLTLDKSEVWAIIRNSLSRRNIQVYLPHMKVELNESGEIENIHFSDFKMTDEKGFTIDKPL